MFLHQEFREASLMKRSVYQYSVYKIIFLMMWGHRLSWVPDQTPQSFQWLNVFFKDTWERKMMKWFSVRMPKGTTKKKLHPHLEDLCSAGGVTQNESTRYVSHWAIFSDSMINMELTRHDIVRSLNLFCFHWHSQTASLLQSWRRA